MYDEGVIKFRAEHRHEALSEERFAPFAAELLSWRQILFHLELLGQAPERYGGAGFGNVSCRIPPFEAAPGRRPFLVSGTQTSGRRIASLAELCVVTAYDPAKNCVESQGPVLPSSEAMTHGALYDLGPEVRAVLHVHAPLLYARRDALGMPCTAADVAYGTPAMAEEVRRLYRAGALAHGIFAMGGHEDGVISFGETAAAAGQVMLSFVARAFAQRYLDEGRLGSLP